MKLYNEQRLHQGRWCYGKTPDANICRQRPTGQGEEDCLVTAKLKLPKSVKRGPILGNSSLNFKEKTQSNASRRAKVTSG
jgi:hypothetical protein